MTVQPNCPHCKHGKFVVINQYCLGVVKNQETKEDNRKFIDLLCCDDCGAVICQVDTTMIRYEEI